MAGESSGLALEVRRKLEAGVPIEDVVQELVARGLSRSSAERFVDQAFAMTYVPPAPRAPRTVSRATIRRFVIIPILGVTVYLGQIGWKAVQRDRERQRAAAVELAAADKARAEEVRAGSRARGLVADEVRTEERDERSVRALSQLSAPQPTIQCDAALVLGRSHSKEYVKPLEALLSTASFTSVRNCAASALVELGETHVAMAAYTEWANGTDGDLRRSALMGFGQIGPSAASVALPHLAEALKSPYWDLRYLAVESLSKLGPTAVPLLEVAAGDTDKNVRERAASVLKTR
jgi:hypothetical protein